MFQYSFRHSGLACLHGAVSAKAGARISQLKGCLRTGLRILKEVILGTYMDL